MIAYIQIRIHFQSCIKDAFAVAEIYISLSQRSFTFTRAGSSASYCTFARIRLSSLHASRYFMLYLDQSATDSSSVPKVSAAGSAGFGSVRGAALYFPRAKSMREKLHPGNMAVQSLPSWPALCAWVYVRCSSGSKENTLFKGSL